VQPHERYFRLYGPIAIVARVHSHNLL
jgi:hypothetical protein